MAAGIIFIVIVQRKVSSTDLLTLQFEVAKSILATGLWLWLMLDSAFGPWKRRQYRDPSREVPRRVARAATAAILLLWVPIHYRLVAMGLYISNYMS